jgi:VWFA-related protein
MKLRALAFLICCVRIVPGQVPSSNPTFRAEKRVVQVPVSVTDKSGRAVEGLSARDFRLLDDGVPREVSMDTFDTGVAPISLVIAVQTSGISGPALVKIRRIGGMIQPMVTGSRGEAAVVAFDDNVAWRLDFTSDSEQLQRALLGLHAGTFSRAHMFDAVGEAANLMRNRKGRKILLLISETRDRGSKMNLKQTLQIVGREGVEVFAAHYSATATAWIAKPADVPNSSSAPQPNTAAPDGPPGIDFNPIVGELAHLRQANSIQALTQATGGADFPFLTEHGIENSIAKFGEEVHSQYILNFSPAEESKGTHKIEVTVPGRADLRIRSRRTWESASNR